LSAAIKTHQTKTKPLLTQSFIYMQVVYDKDGVGKCVD